MRKIRTHYDNLKVARDAPQEIIRAAYKALSQKHHPDKNNNSEESQRIMKIINDSYRVLSSTTEREKHDDWIKRNENTSHFSETSSRQSYDATFEQRNNRLPSSGMVSSYTLDPETLNKLTNRAKGKQTEQLLIKQQNVFTNIVWLAILPFWFGFLHISAIDFGWSHTAFYWYAGFTAVVAFLLSRNISKIVLWFITPFKSSLVLTPLYLIKFHLDKANYWPIGAVKDIKATNVYLNGFYNGTHIDIFFTESKETFIFRKKKNYSQMIEKFNLYKHKYDQAILVNDVGYISKNDDFLNLTAKKNGSGKRFRWAVFLVYFLVFLISSIIFSFSYLSAENALNSEYEIVNNKSNFVETANYKRPLTAPNGQPWPDNASYLDYPKLMLNGFSSVIVDNTRNNSDVFVKLVNLSRVGSDTIRVLFIPAYSKFKIEKVEKGFYDVRYKDLDTGMTYKTESFAIEERQTGDGIEFVDMSITIYKVPNGNMKTYKISEDEF